jgi:hypothetical protein
VRNVLCNVRVIDVKIAGGAGGQSVTMLVVRHRLEVQTISQNWKGVACFSVGLKCMRGHCRSHLSPLSTHD